MEQKVFSKFNVYDQIGYLMVGAVAILLIVFNAIHFLKITVPSFNVDTFLAWFVIAYFLGHLIQGITNLITDSRLFKFIIPENKTDFTEEQKEILQKAKNYFKLEKQDDSKLWNICYILANAKDVTGQVQAFNSYYSLYRGWFIIFCLEGIFVLPFLFISFSWATLMIFMISFLLAAIFRRRLMRFWSYTRNKVLETFVVVVKTLDL